MSPSALLANIPSLPGINKVFLKFLHAPTLFQLAPGRSESTVKNIGSLHAKIRTKGVVRDNGQRFWCKYAPILGKPGTEIGAVIYTRREKFVVPPAANSPFLTLFPLERGSKFDVKYFWSMRRGP